MINNKNTFTKGDIVNSVREKTDCIKYESARLVELVFNTIKKELISGGDVKISGFGNFVTSDRKERVGRNPQTGGKIRIKARRVVTFKVSQILKENVNGK